MKTAEVNHEFEALLDFLKRNRGFDFTGYKRASLMRRTNKRLHEIGIHNYIEYLDYLQINPDEFTNLFNTILINVTGFFRDPEAWDFLAAEILPNLLADRQPDEPIRAWSTGTASGEEAYTLAILLTEAIGEEAARERVKIYATDLDEEALEKARHARYTAKDLENIPPNLLGKYFEQIGGSYAFRKDLRRILIFGRHDIVQDAPISRIDLLVCRNLLMYFNPAAQAKILARLHFALKDGGYFFLGKAEMLLSHAHLFAPVDLRFRIFKKVSFGNFRERMAVASNAMPGKNPNQLQDQSLIRELLLDNAPEPYLILDRHGQLLMINKRARALFGLQSENLGQPFHNLEISYRPVDLRSPLAQASAELKPVSISEVEMQTPSGLRYYNIRVVPLLEAERRIVGLSIAFEDISAHKDLYRQLENANQELETAMEELQSTNEELETTNEELQSTIEELETTNEELQSANEELETMNEELQSTNQEMETINNELRERSQEFNQINLFLQAILSSFQGGVIVLDPQLQILIWNRKSEDLWGLRSSEVVGQHFLNLDFGLPAERLAKTVRSCLTGPCSENPVFLEARNRRGRDVKCQVSITPLVSEQNDTQGVILVVEELDDS